MAMAMKPCSLQERPIHSHDILVFVVASRNKHLGYYTPPSSCRASDLDIS